MDRQVRRMVTQRTGEDTSVAETIEPAAAVVPSDSDEDKNENVCRICIFFLPTFNQYFSHFLEGGRGSKKPLFKLWD